MKTLLALFGGFLLLCLVLIMSPFILAWYCIELFAIKFLGD